MRPASIRGTRRGLAAVAAALTVLTAPAAYAAAGGKSGPLQRLSADDPVAGCTTGPGAAGPGQVAPHSTESPVVAVNPRDPRQSVVAWAQDSWSAPGGARADVYAFTRDGVHFTEGVLPFGACAGAASVSPTVGREDLPWLSWGPDGAVYATTTEIDFTTGHSAIGAASSLDGGATWKFAQSLRGSTFPPAEAGEATVTADPTRPGTAYLVADQADAPAGGPITDPAELSITHDHGRTWSTPQVIGHTDTPMTGTLGNHIVIDPRTGRLYDVFLDRSFTSLDNDFYASIRSDDGGATWTAPQRIVGSPFVADTDPNDPAQRLLTSEGLNSAAVDPVTGTLYVAFEGADFTGGKVDQAELAKSTDGGTTWSAPKRISQDPNSPAYTPSITVGPTGTLSALYYDLRHLAPGNTTTLPTSTWLETFPFGDLDHPTERQIAPDFDFLQAPSPSGHYIGVYEGLAPSGLFGVRVAFVATLDAPNHPSDVYTDVFEPFH
ncbi:sialidase family protein [Catenulispora yoronensis]|uniref:Sialidase family protein n=1 Tax=Catenulispora yoronensis TaxID=450799 RepID=A0ABP5FCI9_9ACTN